MLSVRLNLRTLDLADFYAKLGAKRSCKRVPNCAGLTDPPQPEAMNPADFRQACMPDVQLSAFKSLFVNELSSG